MLQHYQLDNFFLKKLLERTLRFSLPTELIDETEEKYLRYEFTYKKDASIDIRYLQAMAGRWLKDEKVKSQPLKFVPYIEKNRAGIDVLLASQYKGLSQLADYYKAKYHLASGKGFQVSTSSIDEFFKSLKAYEDKTGIRLSLFMVTNANQFTNQNRVKELQKKS